jgi:ring-1,2-phenylacetyl-CoA epoxidase subunit PaaC
MGNKEALLSYCLRIGDNALIMGHRMSQWCGHGPILEQDIALINIALDHIGQARNWYSLAAEIEGKNRTEDDFAYKRDAHEFKNVLLVEQPNGNWGDTIMRGFFFDTFNYFLHQEIQHSKNEKIASIAEKSLKEIQYHYKFSSEWVIRLGDGTKESHQKMQDALDSLWMFAGEMFHSDDIDHLMKTTGYGADLDAVKNKWTAHVKEVITEATLKLPADTWYQQGGKVGKHSEHMGYILAEMQFLPRAYPDATW